MKKYILLLITAMLFSATNALAQVGGTIGNLTWYLDNGTLTISGEGEMPDFWNSGISPPWYYYEHFIITAVIETGITNVGSCAFASCKKLTSATIPSSVTSIDPLAFTNCTSLTSVTIPNSVTYIGRDAFFDCRALTSIVIPYGVKSIEHHTFEGCMSLTSVTIPNSVTSIGWRAFGCCASLPSITIPNSVTTIGDEVFNWCYNLTSITIPNSVTNIGQGVFYKCLSLISIDVENENNSFASEDGILYNKSKTSLICYPGGRTGSYIISNDITSIGDFAFAWCINLTSITIPNSVESIGWAVFDNCSDLISVTIPSSVTSIGQYAFYGCKNLTLITNLNPVPVNIYPDVFDKVNQSVCTLEVPMGSVSAYKSANVWKKFKIVGIMVDPHLVSVSANNDEYGTVTGGGIYDINTTATVTATAKDGYKFVNWTKDGEEVSIENPYNFTVTEDVELVANFEEEVGIEQLRITNYELRVHPNPTSGEIVVSSEYRVQSIDVFDIFGKKVSHLTISHPISISGLPAGIYFVQIQTDKGIITRKIIKN